MKIHNYGNDYAFQQKQKSMKNEEVHAEVKVLDTKEEKVEIQVQESEKTEKTNVGDQVQDGREREVEEPSSKSIGQSEEIGGENAFEHSEEKRSTTIQKKKKQFQSQEE